MPQSLSHVIVHVIFSTKARKRWLDDDIRDRVHAYLARVLRDLGACAYRVGGTDDHVHVAFTLPRTLTQSQLVSKIKSTSSQWIKKLDAKYAEFIWQTGYGIFSVSRSHLDRLIAYIQGQVEHHYRWSVVETIYAGTSEIQRNIMALRGLKLPGK